MCVCVCVCVFVRVCVCLRHGRCEQGGALLTAEGAGDDREQQRGSGQLEHGSGVAAQDQAGSGVARRLAPARIIRPVRLSEEGPFCTSLPGIDAVPRKLVL